MPSKPPYSTWGEHQPCKDHFAEFRGRLRGALHPFWPSNPGVSDDEVIDAVAKAAHIETPSRSQLYLLRKELRATLKGQVVLSEHSPDSEIVDAVAQAQRDLLALHTLRPLADYHEDHGTALWWKLPIVEPPYVGTPGDDSWPGDKWATHWTPLPRAEAFTNHEESMMGLDTFNSPRPAPKPPLLAAGTPARFLVLQPDGLWRTFAEAAPALAFAEEMSLKSAGTAVAVFTLHATVVTKPSTTFAPLPGLTPR